MANWCDNYMEITGSSDEIARFKRTCVVFAAEQAHLDFDAIVPVPGILTQKAFDWACEHWGTDRWPWDFEVIRDEPNSYECKFVTAWTPPVGIWRKLGEMFPTLEFSLSGFEPLMDFAFRGTIRDGKLELLDVPLIWKTVDPKTGKTVSGTREEIDAVLGERGGWASARAGRSEREAGNHRHEMSGSEAAARERRRSDCPF